MEHLENLWNYLTPSSRIQMDGHERLMCINEESFSYLQVDKTSTFHAINYDFTV